MKTDPLTEGAVCIIMHRRRPDRTESEDIIVKKRRCFLLVVAMALTLLLGHAAAEIQFESEIDAPNRALFMGNSILLGTNHYVDEEGTDLFPANPMYAYGLCATNHTRDYYWQVKEAILQRNPEAEFFRVYGVPFERLEPSDSFDDLWRTTINGFTGAPLCESFTPDLDLIIIQLGDNVNTDAKAAAFAVNIESLLANVISASPNARILWVDGWYQHSRTHETVVEACQRWGIEEIDIHDLKTEENFGIKGQWHEIADRMHSVNSLNSLTHPGDTGMTAIANAILHQLYPDWIH